jgi:hypothetical protein
MRIILAGLLFTLGLSNVMSAQFVTPIPGGLASGVVLREFYAGGLRAWSPIHDSSVRDSLTNNTLTATTLANRFCTEYEATRPTALATCNDVATSIIAANDSDFRSTPHTFLHFSLPFGHDRRELVQYLRSASGTSGLTTFGQFAANLSDKEAYVVTDVISGLAARVLFAIQYAAVVTKSDEVDSATRRSIESERANALRLINNGGTITARIQMPLFAAGGSNAQGAVSTYVTAGLLGPMGNPDSLGASGSAVLEAVEVINVRDALQGLDLLGQVLIGARIGVAYAENAYAPSGRKHTAFIQASTGLRQGKKIGLSVLITYPFDRDTRGLTPRLVVNFSAIR